MRWLVATLVAFVLAPVAPARAALTPGWTSLPNLSEPRAWAEAVVLDSGKVLIAGGLTADSMGGMRTAELFDPVTGTWSRAASMNYARSAFAMVKLADGRVLAAGADGAQNITAEVYDATRDAWSVVGPLHSQRGGSTLIALADGGALIVGGESTVERFDPTTHAWSPAVAMFPGEPRFTSAAAPLPGNRVLVTGGQRPLGSPGAGFAYFGDAGAFDDRLAWNPMPSMRNVRSGHALVALRDGRVLAVGGHGGAGIGRLRSAETFDASTNLWEDAGQLQSQRNPVELVALADGSAMVIGGDGADFNPVASAERFVPATKTWTSAGTLATPRSLLTAVRLADGRVLVAGGYDYSRAQRISSAEIWTPTATLAGDPVAAFGDQGLGSTGTTTAQLTNAGDQPLITESFALTGAHAGDFAVDGSRCRVVAPRAMCAVDIRFTPSALGARAATLSYAANTTSGAHTVALSGRGIEAPPGIPLLGTVDADRDGIPDALDRCAKAAGTTTRSGCPTGLLNDPSIRYQRLKRGIKVLAYYVKATTGARIVVTCSKRACKRGTAVGRGAKPVRIKALNGRRLKNGTRITVTVSKPGRLTTTVYDTVVRARRSEGRPRCAPVGC